MWVSKSVASELQTFTDYVVWAIGGSRDRLPARATAALPMDRVTGGPIKAGAGLAAVVAEHVGWAGCRREGGQGPGVMDPRRGCSRWSQAAEV